MGMTEKQVKDVCKIQTENCCAFLIAGPDGFECTMNTSLEMTIRTRLEEGTMNATGENCDGFKEETTND